MSLLNSHQNEETTKALGNQDHAPISTTTSTHVETTTTHTEAPTAHIEAPITHAATTHAATTHTTAPTTTAATTHTESSTTHTGHPAEAHLSTKDKIKEKIHKVKDKLSGKDHEAHAAPRPAGAPLSTDMAHDRDMKHEGHEIGEAKSGVGMEHKEGHAPGLHGHVQEGHGHAPGSHGHVPTAQEFAGTGLGIVTSPGPGCRFHGLTHCECPGAHVDSMGMKYCDDMRCHEFEPCARHPVLPKHHHHGVREPVDLRPEEVVIERRPIRNPETYSAHSTEDRIAIPLYEEEVVVEKRLVPREEIIVRKREVIDTKVVSTTLKREVADINRVPEVSSAPDAKALNAEGQTFPAEKAVSSSSSGGHDLRDVNQDGHVSLTEKIKDKLHLGPHQAK